MTNLSDKFPVKTAADFYKPAMMEFDGSSGYYNRTYTPTGNKVTMVCRFKVPSFTGGSVVVLGVSAATAIRLQIFLSSSDHANATQRNKLAITCQNTSVATICNLYSSSEVADNSLHTVFASFDADNGLSTLYIDGADEDDLTNPTRVAPTTGTLPTTSVSHGVGAYPAGLYKTNGQIGFFGISNAYLTNWSDFMHSDGRPKELNESGWTEWGAQPLFWNEHGDMTNNLGSAGDMTKNGTIEIGKGGN